MNMNNLSIREAGVDDALALAELINFAGEGLPVYLWEKMAEPGENVWDVGCSRAKRPEGSFSYRNAVCAQIEGQTVACLIGYPLASTPEEFDEKTTPPLFVPLLELEAEASDTWYVNVLATYPVYRSQGIGTKLLDHAQHKALDAGKKRLSLIVADNNAGAIALYQKSGFKQCAKRTMVKEDWKNPGENWILMIK